MQLLGNCFGVALLFTAALSFANGDNEAFLKTERLISKHHYSGLQSKLEALESHPLHPYLQAKWIGKQFHRTPIAEIDAYLAQYQGQPSAIQLQRSWLNYLAKKQKWALFLDYFKQTENLSLRCHKVSALEATHQPLNALIEGQSLWLLGQPLPKACDQVFANWKRHGFLSDDLVWRRYVNAIEQKEYRLANYLKKSLPKKLQKMASNTLYMWRHPITIFHSHNFKQLDNETQFILYKKAIKQSPDQFHQLTATRSELPLTSQQFAQLERIAYLNAPQKSSQDLFQWYESAQKRNIQDNDIQISFLQGALSNQNWPLYCHLYKLLPADITQQSKWQYWYGRALEEIGSPTEVSIQSYELAAMERDYYGFMASQKMGISASMNHDPTHVPNSTLQTMRLNPAVKRAMAFLDIGRVASARREWQYAFNNNPDLQSRHALALLAGHIEWSDRAIMTLAQLEDWHDLQLRFPLAHANTITKEANRNNISPTWVFGITRQESAFMEDARSPVGATGLMQLMPATARSVSRSLRIAYSDKKLVQPDYNIRLGSRYLQQLLNRYKGNRVLATAAYNAGPGNVNRWIKSFSGPLDIWVESIPYNETKEYVQRVLAYSTIYSYRLGELQPIIDPLTQDAWNNLMPNNLLISKSLTMQNDKG